MAIMADVHFVNVFPEFEDNQGYTWPTDFESSETLIHTMAAQLRSTRLFNENYFAFKIALDDAVAKGIKIKRCIP